MNLTPDTVSVNAVVGETSLAARPLLDTLLSIEHVDGVLQAPAESTAFAWGPEDAPDPVAAQVAKPTTAASGKAA